jgi:chemotaxis protein CheD
MSAKLQQPKCLIGFEHINRYWDPTQNVWMAKLLPGQYYINKSQNEVIATTLGSCVSACIRSTKTGVGGMNHFMLPINTDTNKATERNNNRYGDVAMDSLIKDILSFGGNVQDLEIKVVGGGRILSEGPDVGADNIAFILNYLEMRNLDAKVEQLGGDYPRKVIYYPSMGRLMIKHIRVQRNTTILEREKAYQQHLRTALR